MASEAALQRPQSARQYRLDIGGAERSRIQPAAVFQRCNGFSGRCQAQAAGMDAVQPVPYLLTIDWPFRQVRACGVERSGRSLGDCDDGSTCPSGGSAGG